jgi:hypothetical protein
MNDDIMPLIQEIKDNLNNRFDDLKSQNTVEHKELKNAVKSINDLVGKHDKFIIRAKVVLWIFGAVLSYLVLPVLQKVILKLLNL